MSRDCWITIQKPSEGQDSVGQPLTTWDAFDNEWADIRHVSGLEAVKADATASVVKASIRIRYREDLNSGMRVLHGSTVYDIRAALPDLAGKRYVDLVCEAVS
jgi:SPP1 family predicted phage head-tail adaptor